MADLHIDILNGDDVNDGSDWANAVETFNRAKELDATSQKYKFAKSPDPTQLTSNATWTKGSWTVTLGAAVTKTLANCTNDETGWTAGANCTVSFDTSYDKMATGDLKIDIGTVSGAELLAYIDISGGGAGEDLSGYEQISFWFRTYSAPLAAGLIQVKLCSDTAGVTAVDTFDVPANGDDDQWVACLVDKAAALGSAIKSIGIYSTGALSSSEYLYFQNIIACKASSDADSLNLTSLISKNSLAKGGAEPWHAIHSIDGVTVILAKASNSYYSDSFEYGGSTETVATYKRETSKEYGHPNYTQPYYGIYQPIAGTSGTHTIVSGGWDTGTDTQDGETFIDACNGESTGIYSYGVDYIDIEYMSFVRFNMGISFSGNTQLTHVFTYLRIIACGSTSMSMGMGVVGSDPFENVTFNNMYITGSPYRGFDSTKMNYCTVPVTINFNDSYFEAGSYDYGIYAYRWANVDLQGLKRASIFASQSRLIIHDCDELIGNRSIYSSLSDVRIYNVNKITGLNNGGTWGTGLYLQGSNFKITDCEIDGNYVAMELLNSTVYLCNCLLSATTEIVGDDPQDYYKVYSDKHDQVAGAYKVFGFGYEFYRQSTVKDTSTHAWRLEILDYNKADVNIPISNRIAIVPCVANKLVTFKVKYRRDSTNVTAKLVCKGGQIAGVASDVTDTLTAAADTWEELELTFTPTEAGTVEIIFEAYSTGNDNLYIDSFDVTQAA